jgi:DNA mismatch endonuclease (patch repair protein)
MMSGIRGRNTRPETRLRSALHARGLRYRLHVGGLPGTPDIVFPRFRAAIMVHGCFWHRHEGCRYATNPETRPDFWQEKFRKNVERDRAKARALSDAGWRVATVWECALRRPESVESLVDRLIAWLKSDHASVDLGGPPELQLAEG